MDGQNPNGLAVGPTGTADLGRLSAVSPDDDGRHPLVVEIERLRAELTDANHKLVNLDIALGSSREIGAAVGIVMAAFRATYDQAFDMLTEVSQHTNRKLRDVAADVLFTGGLPETTRRSRPRGTRTTSADSDGT